MHILVIDIRSKRKNHYPKVLLKFNYNWTLEININLTLNVENPLK